MASPAEMAALIAMPVTNRPEAEAFIQRLHELELSYHFDDGAVDALHGTTIKGVPLVTLEEAEAIDLHVQACYIAWEQSGADMMHDCPIGHSLKVMGL